MKTGPASSAPFYAVPALPQLLACQVSAMRLADSTRMAVAVGNSVELIRLAESVAWTPRLEWHQDHRGPVGVRARTSPGAAAMGASTDLNYRGHTARDRLGARRHLAPVRWEPLKSSCKISLMKCMAEKSHTSFYNLCIACELRCRRCRPFGPAQIALSNCSVDTTYIIRLDVVWQPCAQNT